MENFWFCPICTKGHQRDLIRRVALPSPTSLEKGQHLRPVPSPSQMEKVDRAKPETDEVPLVATNESHPLVARKKKRHFNWPKMLLNSCKKSFQQ